MPEIDMNRLFAPGVPIKRRRRPGPSDPAHDPEPTEPASALEDDGAGPWAAAYLS
jgi:hypothetical protein